MSRMNRRRFLEDSLLAITAAGAAANGFGYASWAHAQEATGEQTPVAANDKIGAAIIGSGGRANSHINSFLNDPRVTILYVCDPDPRLQSARLDKIAEKQNGLRPKFVKDMREAFADKAVDIVSCATTNHWHTLCGIWALEAGKHAYLEKPISHNMHEGYAIEAAAKKYGKVVQTGSQSRSSKALIDAVAFIREGGIGDVKFARGLCYKRRKSIGPKGEYPVPKEVDYDLWSGPAQILPVTRPRFRYDWHWQREYGNGDLGNQGPHQTDIARWFLDIDRYPTSVFSYGGRLGYQAERKDADYIDAGDTANTEVSIYDYGDKCIVFETRGLQTQSLCCPNGKRYVAPKPPIDPATGKPQKVDLPPRPPVADTSIGVIAYGSKGYMVQSGVGYCAAFDLDGEPIREFKGDIGNHYSNFVDAVVANDPSMVTASARVGALSAAMSHMGNISYYLGENDQVSVAELKTTLDKIKSLDDNIETLDRTVEHLEKNGVDLKKYPISLGRQLTFDADKLVFADPEAQKLATREYREGYVVS